MPVLFSPCSALCYTRCRPLPAVLLTTALVLQCSPGCSSCLLFSLAGVWPELTAAGCPDRAWVFLCFLDTQHFCFWSENCLDSFLPWSKKVGTVSAPLVYNTMPAMLEFRYFDECVSLELMSNRTQYDWVFDIFSLFRWIRNVISIERFVKLVYSRKNYLIAIINLNRKKNCS